MAIVDVAFNIRLLDVLRGEHPDRLDRLPPERTNTLHGGKGKRPDIVLSDTADVPVVVETVFMPAPTVEEDAGGRLGAVRSRGGHLCTRGKTVHPGAGRGRKPEPS